MSDTAVDTLRSAHLYQRAAMLMPGGVNSPVRAMRAIGRDPIFIASGSGPIIRDVDGNEYIDWVSSWGPLILGHAHPDVVAAVTEAAARGTTFGAPTPGEVELAERIAERVPSVQMLRMTSSGTEATMSALRLARGRHRTRHDRQVLRRPTTATSTACWPRPARGWPRRGYRPAPGSRRRPPRRR